MDKRRQWVALTLVAVLAVLAGGWVLLISPTRSEAGTLREQALSNTGSNEQLENQIAVLKARAADLPQQQAELAALATKIPYELAEPDLLRALAGAAAEAGVELVAVTPGALAAVATATAATPAPVDSTTATATTPAAAAPTAGTLQSLPLVVKVAGDYAGIERYAALLEDLPRALRLTGLSITLGPDPTVEAAASAGVPDGTDLLADLNCLVFVAAGTPAAAAPAAAAVAPAAVPTS